jgi:hypothetical protein
MYALKADIEGGTRTPAAAAKPAKAARKKVAKTAAMRKAG